MTTLPPDYPDGFDKSLPVEEQALFWVIFLDAALDDEEGQDAFSHWLASDKRHGPAFAKSAQIWRELQADGAAGMTAPPRAPPIRSASRQSMAGSLIRRIPAAALVLAACIAVAVLLSPLLRVPVPKAAPVDALQLATAPGESRTFELADGSMIELGGDTRVEVALGADQRQASIDRGQAYFDIASDSSRPFSIAAAEADILVLGTVFDIHLGPDTTTISLLEGALSVTAAHSGSVRLSAGEQVQVTGYGEFGDVHIFEAEQVLGWRNQRFFYEDSPLKALVADLNRYSDHPIVLDNQEIALLSVSASFDLRQREDVLNGLAAALSLEVVQMENQTILKQRSDEH